jgi:hypothetical protein
MGLGNMAKRTIKTTRTVELTRGQKAAATKLAKREAAILAAQIEAERIASLTPGQKAAETKRNNGANLSAIALKAVATRRANQEAQAQMAILAESAQAERDNAERLSAIAHKAVATRRANMEARNGGTVPVTSVPVTSVPVQPEKSRNALVAALQAIIATLA